MKRIDSNIVGKHIGISDKHNSIPIVRDWEEGSLWCKTYMPINYYVCSKVYLPLIEFIKGSEKWK